MFLVSEGNRNKSLRKLNIDMIKNSSTTTDLQMGWVKSAFKNIGEHLMGWLSSRCL